MSTLMHLLGALSVPLMAAIGLYLGGPWLFLPLFWFTGVALILDWIIPPDQRYAVPEGGIGSAAVVWPIFPVLTALLGYGLFRVAEGQFDWWEVLGAAIAVGMANGGIGLTASHELIHRKAAWERGLGIGLASLVLNAPFRIEHVFGHHRTVATPDDPTTARVGENIYAFMPRCYVGSLKEAWRIEAEQLHKRGFPTLHWRNRMLHYGLLHAVTLGVVVLWLGPVALGFFVLQAAIGIQLLQGTAYIEHYGLARSRSKRGAWERMGPSHSWNSAHRITNWMTFNIGLHAEHHTWPSKPFTELVDDRAAMRMPFGYPGMLLMAMVPPLWFRVMNPRIAAATAPDGPS